MNIGTKTALLCLAAGLWIANTAQAGTATYRNTVLADNPIVYYEFDETGGSTATNIGSSGATHHGTHLNGVAVGKATFTEGGTSYEFTPASGTGGGRVTTATAVSTLTEWTVEAWMNWDDSVKTKGLGIFGNDLGGWNNDVLFGIQPEETFSPAGKLAAIQQGKEGGTGIRDITSYPLSADTWHHVVATGSTSNSALKLYVDGALVATDNPMANGMTLNGAKIAVGDIRINPDRDTDFDGLIDEFALYGTALDATTVEAHFDAGNFIPPPPPPPPPPPADVLWTMVVLADTHQQGYFPEMTQWIVDNKDARNIKLVIHNGDITNTNAAAEWAAGKAAMTTLDDEVPYMIAPGNHEYEDNADNRNTLMNDYFDLADNPLNNSATEGIVTVERVPGEVENTYATFTAPDGRKMLIFSLEFGPRQEVVDWANGIASLPQYQDHTAVLSTHAYMDLVSQGGRDSSRWNPHDYGVAPDVHDGEELWDELVSVNGNFEMTFNGHYIGAVDRQQSVGINGNTVYEMVHNRQYESYGYIRLLEFLDDGKTVQVRTYSTAGTWLTDPANEFQIELSQVPEPSSLALGVLGLLGLLGWAWRRRR